MAVSRGRPTGAGSSSGPAGPMESSALGPVTPRWLALREPADSAARDADLAKLAAGQLTAPLVITDLGSGTGSMGRWLAPRLPGPQQWVMVDRDPVLLELAQSRLPAAAADGTAVTAATSQADLTRITAADLAETSLVTASALLDMLTADEIERVVAACAGASCPALLTLSVTGRAELTPPDPFDAVIEAAFNAHQRRATDGRTPLGPDAAVAAAAAFRAHSMTVTERPSPWRIGAEQRELAAEWLRGWIGAACEQEPELAGPAAEYTVHRLADAAAGRLGVIVHHQDLLAVPVNL